MYVLARESGLQDLGAVDVECLGRHGRSGFNALGQQPTPTAGAGATTSKCDDVVGKPVILDRFIEGRWSFPSFQKLRMLVNQKDPIKALQLIGSLEKAYSNRPEPKISKFQWVFR